MSNNNYSAMSVINDLMMSDGGDNSSVMSNSSSMSTGSVSAGGGSVSLSTLIQHWKADSGSLDGIIIAVFVLIGLVAVVTNSLVVISVALNKNLRAPLDTAIASLAVIDIVTGVVGIPVIILVYQSGNY